LPDTKIGFVLVSGAFGIRVERVLREGVPAEPEEPVPRCAVASVPAHTITNIMQMTNLRKRYAIAASQQKIANVQAQHPQKNNPLDN
jgi:hypothetical protein